MRMRPPSYSRGAQEIRIGKLRNDMQKVASFLVFPVGLIGGLDA